MKLTVGEILLAFALSALLCSLGGCDVAPATAAAPVDVTGRWSGTLTMQAGPMGLEVVLLSEPDGQVTGTALLPTWEFGSAKVHPDAQIVGDVRDNIVSLAFAWTGTGAFWAVDGLALGDVIEGHLREEPTYTLRVVRP